jgi:hypothetical protein
LIIPPTAACEYERQFVRYGGQEWTTLKRLAADYHNRLEEEAPRLLGIGTEPEFAIGLRALFLQSNGGNLLWGCITLLDGQTAAELNARGGICAIAISHPHYYTTMVDWAERFDAQIFLHTADREWGDAQESAHPILGRNSAFVVGWSDADQLRPTFRWRRGVALASRCKRQRRIAHRRHHPSRARSPLCELHAKLCEPDSARAGRDSTYSQKDRTILSRTNLWRVVESERSLTSMSHRAGVSGRQFV